MAEPASSTPPTVRPSEDRLDSWKEIAAYLDRDVTTVQRWEKREGMPVYRHQHDRIGSVYASRAALDGWVRSRNLRTAVENGNEVPLANPPAPSRPVTGTYLTRWKFILALTAVLAVVVIGVALWLLR